MNKIKWLVPAFAFVFAIAGAFVTQAHNAKVSLASAFGQTSSDCRAGTIVENNTCDGPSGTQCTVTISGLSGSYPAYNTDGGTTCSSPKFFVVE